LITNVVQTDEGWWEGTNGRNQRGLFPASYVEVQSSAPVAVVQPLPVSLPVQVPVAVQAPIPTPIPAPAPVSKQKTAVAIYDYEAAEDNEISFATGDTIHDIDFVSDDWWSGTVRGKSGLFPGNYVELQ
jgi:hypothetical protein